jgi:hypothetical protein
MEIRFAIDVERLTLDDLITLESGSPALSFVRDLLARFMVDGTGKPLPEEQARAVLGRLNLRQLQETSAKFVAAMGALKDELVPLGK